jgi:hypothetical protein
VRWVYAALPLRCIADSGGAGLHKQQPFQPFCGLFCGPVAGCAMSVRVRVLFPCGLPCVLRDDKPACDVVSINCVGDNLIDFDALLLARTLIGIIVDFNRCGGTVVTLPWLPVTDLMLNSDRTFDVTIERFDYCD